MGLVSGLSLASRLACAHIWSDSGSFLVARASLSQGGFQREGLWEAGCLLPLVAPPGFSRLVFGGSTVFLIGTSCRETAQASGPGHGGGIRCTVPSQWGWGRQMLGLWESVLALSQGPCEGEGSPSLRRGVSVSRRGLLPACGGGHTQQGCRQGRVGRGVRSAGGRSSSQPRMPYCCCSSLLKSL